MSIQNRSPANSIPIYSIGPLDRVTVAGKTYRFVSTDADGHVFAHHDNSEPSGFLHSEFFELIKNGVASIETDFYKPRPDAIRRARRATPPETANDAELHHRTFRCRPIDPLWVEFATLYLNDRRLTAAEVFVALMAKIQKLNLDSRSAGLLQLRAPCRRTFDTVIRRCATTAASARKRGP